MNPVLPDAIAEGRFQLLEVIGEGGMAVVYRAFDQRLQRPRAIKVLAPALAGRPQLRKRFLHEAQTMATLEESRVVRVFDMGEDGDRVYIVMELVDGGSLLDRVRNHGPLPARMAAAVGLQICESLQAAHDAGVIHRDIKPHNILLTRSGDIRITDFGIAQVQQEGDAGLTKTGAVMGTWGFMAPEQKSNAKNVDARADLYSVGATLWSLLRGDTPPELFMADAEPEMLEGIPDALAEVIRRATRYRREDRYPTVRAMADSIRSLMPLLPDDPTDSPPLVCAPVIDLRPPADTIDQFRTPAPGGFAASPAAIGTMVPDIEEIPPLITRPAVLGGSSVLIGSHGDGAPSRGDPPRAEAHPGRRGRWLGAVSLLGLGLAGLLVLQLIDRKGPNAVPVAGPMAEAVLPASPEVVAMTREVASAPPPASPPPAAGGQRPAAAVTQATPPSAEPVATDVAVTALDPGSVEAAPEPVEVRPVARPTAKLVHTPPAATRVGESVSVSAQMGAGWHLKLYYRAAGSGAFRDKAMGASGDSFSTTLKVDESMAGGIEYFIAATDERTTVREGSAGKPLRIAIAPD